MTATAPTRWCPTCGAEYQAGVEDCLDCGVPLVDQPPPERSPRPAPDPAAGHEPVGYDLSDWDRDRRAALEWMLAGRNIPFEWGEDDVLLVPPALADDVEGFLDYLESGDDEDQGGKEDDGDAPSPWWPA
jgi:hypothetical protein